MRAVVQRVSSASVTIEGVVVGAIDRGLLILLGVQAGEEVPCGYRSTMERRSMTAGFGKFTVNPAVTDRRSTPTDYSDMLCANPDASHFEANHPRSVILNEVKNAVCASWHDARAKVQMDSSLRSE